MDSGILHIIFGILGMSYCFFLMLNELFGITYYTQGIVFGIGYGFNFYFIGSGLFK